MRLAIKMMLGVILLMKLMSEGIHAKAFLVETADDDGSKTTGKTQSLVQQVYVHRFCVGVPVTVPTHCFALFSILVARRVAFYGVRDRASSAVMLLVDHFRQINP